MSSGLSFESFASVAGVHRDTLYEWLAKHREFSDAKKRGEALSLRQWEQLGIDGMLGKVKGFNATIWIFNMKNRFRWRDLQPEPTPTEDDWDEDAPPKGLGEEYTARISREVMEAQGQLPKGTSKKPLPPLPPLEQAKIVHQK